jgi:hypothetical protein
LGQVEKFAGVAADQLIQVTEGSGITGADKLPKAGEARR